MIATRRLAVSRDSGRRLALGDRGRVMSDYVGRLLQTVLAIYLLPALVIVLAVGAVGMIILAVSRFWIAPVHRSVP